MNATMLSKWILVAAMSGSGLIYLPLGSYLPGGAAPLDQIRASPAVEAIVPARLETTGTGPSSARPSFPAESGTKFRFGFLEFEDDPDAPAK